MMMGLKGAPRIVLDELRKQHTHTISHITLANRTCYDRITVWRALRELEELGLIRVIRKGRGSCHSYVVEDSCSSG